jgi:hypothetical protein
MSAGDRYPRPAGPAAIVLAHDLRHTLRAEHAEIEAGVLIAWTDRGVRAWPMSMVASVRFGPRTGSADECASRTDATGASS